MEVQIKPSYLLKTGGMYFPISTVVIEKALECGFVEEDKNDKFPNVYIYKIIKK